MKNIYRVIDVNTNEIVTYDSRNIEEIKQSIVSNYAQQNRVYHNKYRFELDHKEKNVSSEGRTKPRFVADRKVKTRKAKVSLEAYNNKAISMGLTYGELSLLEQLDRLKQEEKNRSENVVSCEWVSIYEDLPLKDPKFKNVSVDVDVILFDGTILKNCFYNDCHDSWHNNNGKRILKKCIQGWRSTDDSLQDDK